MAEPSAGLEISHPHLHGLLADGYWKHGVFTRFNEVDLKAIEETFAERVLAQLHKRELITDDDVVPWTRFLGLVHGRNLQIQAADLVAKSLLNEQFSSEMILQTSS
jgi:hypothetical protein